MYTVTNMKKEADHKYEWGTITWLCNAEIDPDAEMTVGFVCIEPNKANPRHSHPNCEETIFILKGECDHWMGDDMVKLKQGDMLRDPRNMGHNAINTGVERIEMIVAYSSPTRQTVGEDPLAFNQPQSGS